MNILKAYAFLIIFTFAIGCSTTPSKDKTNLSINSENLKSCKDISVSQSNKSEIESSLKILLSKSNLSSKNEAKILNLLKGDEHHFLVMVTQTLEKTDSITYGQFYSWDTKTKSLDEVKLPLHENGLNSQYWHVEAKNTCPSQLDIVFRDCEACGESPFYSLSIKFNSKKKSWYYDNYKVDRITGSADEDS